MGDESLFVYGTLHPERAPGEIAAAARRLRPVGAGWIRARRFELGPYPGVVLDESARVEGEVFVVPDEETLARLDAYEDYRAEDEVGSLFRRVETVVTMMGDGSERRCWVYVYNWPVVG